MSNSSKLKLVSYLVGYPLFAEITLHCLGMNAKSYYTY